MMFNKEELTKVTGAELLKDSGKSLNYNISTDTRTIKSNDIYLPLKGANFDGEKFIDKALESGANAYFTTSDSVFDDAELVLKVENTLDAYLNIAKYYRNKINPITIAITGSAGKTTTKELVYSVVSQKYKNQKTF